MKTVLITGFAGSLGTAFTRYCLDNDYLVTGVDNNEWAVAAFPTHQRLTKRLGDFAYSRGSYDLVIHCAAYKHIDLIEDNQHEALMNNYAKTVQLIHNVEHKQFLFISTDKAVEPSSFYGTTKKLGEEYTHLQGGIVARLGNIIGSSGSVIPVWEAALEAGDPLPITDTKMKRYLIEAPEAVHKVMELLEHAHSGQTIVPEMGKEVSILDFANEVVRKHSLTEELPKPYPLTVIGMRPGEKLREKLTWDDEETVFKNLNGIIVRR